MSRSGRQSDQMKKIRAFESIKSRKTRGKKKYLRNRYLRELGGFRVGQGDEMRFVWQRSDPEFLWAPTKVSNHSASCHKI
jgi:hypothetical protein